MAEKYYRVAKDELEEIYKFHYEYTAEMRSRYAWEWEYGYSNPHNSLLVAIKDDDKVIATQGMMSIKIAFGKEIFTTGKNESLLIDSAYRGKSLSTRFYNYAISEYAKEGISCLWGFSRKAIIPLKKANFKIFEGVMKSMVLSISNKQAQQSIPKAKLGGIKGIVLRSAVFLGTLFSSMVYSLSKIYRSKNSDNIQVTEDLRNTNDIVNLYSQLERIYPELIYLYQDTDFFNWRVKKSPRPIKTIFIYEQNELKGYLYLTIQDRFCELTDLTFTDKKYGRLLLKELIKIIDNFNYGFIYYSGNIKNKLNKGVINLLKWYGFLKMKGPSHFVVRNFTFKDEDKLFKIENWYLNELWSEGN